MSVVVRYPTGGRTASGIAAAVERAIAEGRLAPEAVLTPVRALAAELGVSPATVAAAYRRLAARGLVTGAGRRGTRVAPRPPLGFPASPVVPPGARDLLEGNPDPALLPPLRAALRRLPSAPRLYGAPTVLPRLRRIAESQLAADGVPTGALAVLGGALDGVERVLQAHLRPGDRVAVEDPGYTGVLDLLGALGLAAWPVALDDSGPRPESLAAALAAGARAVILTPRAQNPTGAALDAARVRALLAVLEGHPDVLVVEDDHAGPVAGAPALTLAHRRRARWAVVRSVSKSLGPDLRLAVLAGDPATVARVQGRQALGAGWVSHVLQQTVAELWSDDAVARRLQAAAAAYSERRHALLDALGRVGLAAQGRSGLNVWVPVRDEAATVAGMAAAGFAVRAGARYRLKSPPAVRVTVSTLRPQEAPRVARALAAALSGGYARTG